MSDEELKDKIDHLIALVIRVEARALAVQRFLSKGNEAVYNEIEQQRKVMHDMLLLATENKSQSGAARLDKRAPSDMP